MLYSAETTSSTMSGRQPAVALIYQAITRAVRGRRSETLAAHFARATRAERLEAAREIGVTAIWDDMIDPLLT
jgi:hypothetical protein